MQPPVSLTVYTPDSSPTHNLNTHHIAVSQSYYHLVMSIGSQKKEKKTASTSDSEQAKHHDFIISPNIPGRMTESVHCQLHHLLSRASVKATVCCSDLAWKSLLVNTNFDCLQIPQQGNNGDVPWSTCVCSCSDSDVWFVYSGTRGSLSGVTCRPSG